MDYKTHYEILCTYTKALTEDYNKLLRILTKTAQDDIIEERYKGQPRRKNGQFDFGKVRMSKNEYTRVSHQFATDFPMAVSGETYGYFNRNHFYMLKVIESGTYKFLAKVAIVGNEDKINLVREAFKNET